MILSKSATQFAANNNHQSTYNLKQYNSKNSYRNISTYSSYYSPDYPNVSDFSEGLHTLYHKYKAKEIFSIPSAINLQDKGVTNIFMYTNVTN